jgi:rhodanese-related sulfurtransferase
MDGGESEAKRLFHLTILHEASSELSGLLTPRQIAGAFLLTAMGALGARMGFLLLTGPDVKAGGEAGGEAPGEAGGDVAVHRGLDPEEAERLEASLASARRGLLAKAPDVPPRQPHVVSAARRAEGSAFPAATSLVVRWTMDGGRGGILGLGPSARGDVHGPDGESLLLALTGCLITALSRAYLSERLTAMGSALKERNAELDRRVLRQDTLIQALSEMSSRSEAHDLAENFLLFLMGAAMTGRGFLTLHDKAGERLMALSKGVEDRLIGAVDQTRLRQAATRGMFAAGGARAGYLDEPAALAEAGLPPDMPGVWFVADENAYGFAGLGARLDGAPLSADQREAILALTGAFLSCLRNVRLLDASRRLNEALGERNRELQAMLDEVKRCRVEIDGLERAKARIKELVNIELDRVSRVSWADFVLLFGVSVCIGFLFNWASPSGVELWPSHWSRPATPAVEADKAREMLDAGQAVMVDARPQEIFKQGHVPGAINLTPALFDFMYGMRMAKIPPGKPVVVYGRTVSKLYDEDVAGLLARRGHKDVRVLGGGFGAWKDKGYPVKP